MGRRFGLALLVLFSVAVPNFGALAEESVATPAIDTSIFRDGEVEGRDFTFGEWHAKCQQIIKIKRRICNLLSTIVGLDQKPVGSVIIATTDTGIPAMLLSIPIEITAKKDISINAGRAGVVDGKVVNVDFSQIVRPMVCDSSCKYMFPLDPKLVFLLNAGEKVQVSTPPRQPVPKKGKKRPPVIEAKDMSILGTGFAETLAKSTAAW